MATKTTSKNSATQISLLRVCRVHFYLALAFAIQIMAYDAWKLITPETVLQRWILAAGILIGTTIVWYQTRIKVKQESNLAVQVFSLVALDIIVVSIFVYMTRGMASRAVALFAIPIITAGVLKSRAALYTAAFLCIAAYTTAAVAYAVFNFNEGYNIERYGEIGFYSAVVLLLAGLVWAVINPRNRD